MQAYLSLPPSASRAGSAQPPKRLVGFERVDLQPGASRKVTITIDPASSNHPLGVWSEAQKRWVVPSGRYTILVGTSSAIGDLAETGRFDR
jgi:beta-glucosidase